MVALPNNVTTAALALILGIAVGAVGTYWLTSSDTEPQTNLGALGEMEGQGVLERFRALAPEDTSDQEEADVEIRYKTKRDTVRDSVYVPVPPSLPSQPLLSSRSPISVSESKVTWTYWNHAELRFEQKLYAVPQDNFSLRAHALVRAYAPAENVSLAAERTFVGVGVSARWRRLEASLSGLTTPDLGRQRLSVGLRWRVW